MLAPLAHHLSATLVLLDGNIAHGTALDQVRVEGDAGLHEVGMPLPGELPRVLLASQPPVPGILAVRAEVGVAGRTVHARRRAPLPRANVADGLAARPGTPRSVPIEVDLVIKSESHVPLHHVRRDQQFDLADGDDPLLAALRVRTGDVVRALLDLELDVKLHAL